MTRPVKLSILVPVYNEATTVQRTIKRVLDVAFPCQVEVVMVDDASTDGTAEIIDQLHDERLIKLRHPANRGKTAAIVTAAAAATGDYMVPLDADLEYQPEEIPTLLGPVLSGEAQVVYGSRGFGSHSAYSFWYVMGNKAVTTVANVLFNAYIADLETCFKLMPLDVSYLGFAGNLVAGTAAYFTVRFIQLQNVVVDAVVKSAAALVIYGIAVFLLNPA